MQPRPSYSRRADAKTGKIVVTSVIFRCARLHLNINYLQNLRKNNATLTLLSVIFFYAQLPHFCRLQKAKKRDNERTQFYVVGSIFTTRKDHLFGFSAKCCCHMKLLKEIFVKPTLKCHFR